MHEAERGELRIKLPSLSGHCTEGILTRFPPPRPDCRMSDHEERRCCLCGGPEYFILIAAHCQTLLVFAAKTALTPHAVSQGRRRHNRRRHFVVLMFGEHFLVSLLFTRIQLPGVYSVEKSPPPVYFTTRRQNVMFWCHLAAWW